MNKKKQCMPFRPIYVAIILAFTLILGACGNKDTRLIVDNHEKTISGLQGAIIAMETRLDAMQARLADIEQRLAVAEAAYADLEQRLISQQPAPGENPDIKASDPLVDISGITLNTEERDKPQIAALFMEAYGEKLVVASLDNPGNTYAIEAFELLGLPQVYAAEDIDGGVRFSARLELELKPLEEHLNITPWWAGNTNFSPERDGWLRMYRVITLELFGDGGVTLVSFGTGQ